MASIMSCVLTRGKDQDDDENPTRVRVEYPSDDEVSQIIALCRDVTGERRRGYRLDIQGSCCKGPQGINWKMDVDFDDGGAPEDHELAVELTRRIEKLIAEGSK